MTSSLVVDGLILLIVALGLWTGWRQGAIASILSVVGILAGLLIGMVTAPLLMRLTEDVAIRFILAIAVLALFVGLGQMAGSAVGASLRDRMKQRGSQRVDSVLGAIFQTISTLLVVWLVSIPLASGLPGEAGRGLRGSEILSRLNSLAPPALADLPTGIAAQLTDSGLPPLVAPFDGTQAAAEVDAPAEDVADKEMLDRVRPSVIHVLGDANGCRRRLMGSGFVADKDYVFTNAHVVAGTDKVYLDTVLGMKSAKVVYYNPDVDIAVLHSPDLNLPALPWAERTAETGDDAIVMGFPNSGPFQATPVRIRERLIIAGPDIYAKGRVEREAYPVRGSIRQGNSGGPMINPEGDVLGLVFGASVDETETGYALTAAEVKKHVGDYTSLTEKVDTGKCVAK